MAQNFDAAVIRRINEELRRLKLDPLPHWEIVTREVHRWEVWIRGPPGSPYEGGFFKVGVSFPSSYPMVPPKITFQTRIFHPRISGEGDIDLDILSTDWSPDHTMENVLKQIYILLSDPHPQERVRPEEPNQPEEERDIVDAEEMFRTTAKDWTERFAM